MVDLPTLEANGDPQSDCHSDSVLLNNQIGSRIRTSVRLLAATITAAGLLAVGSPAFAGGNDSPFVNNESDGGNGGNGGNPVLSNVLCGVGILGNGGDCSAGNGGDGGNANSFLGNIIGS